MNTSEILESIRNLQNGEQPKTDISEILYRHRCFYLLSMLKDNPYKERLAAESALNRIAIKERYKLCKALFESLNIPYAVIKGAVLSSSAYNDPYLRISGDLDILIRRQDADKLKEVMLSQNFVQGRATDNGIIPFTRREILFQTTMTHQTAPYIKKTSNPLCPYINVDVNMDILWGESDQKSDMEFVLSHIEKTTLFDVNFFKLSAEMEFISLCLHHYKDMNSLYLLTSRGLRLDLFCDIYFYIINTRPNPKIIKEFCKKLKVGQYVYSCIYQAHQIFDSPILHEYLYELDSEKDTLLLDSFGLNQKEKKLWHISLPERIFHTNISEYVYSLLNDEERNKIQINSQYM